MKEPLRRLTRRYAVTLGQYLAQEQEALLVEAYELGRQAIAKGLGVLDMARVHHLALEASLRSAPATGRPTPPLGAAETFLLESLSPFEVTHRGFRETNVRLQQLIATLEKRNLDLARVNRELLVEIGERKRTEAALRASERGLRLLFHEARRMEADLRRLSNQVLRAQEEERKRISRELHDEVGQALVAVSVTLAGLQQGRAGSSAEAKLRLRDAHRLLETAMTTVHDFAARLRPALLDELGLLPALRSHLNDLSSRTGLTITFRADPIAEVLDDQQKTVLFRVAQESLNNVVKHARASRVTVSLRNTSDALCLEIADNGCSFRDPPPSPTPGRQRLGLLGMQERVRLIDGRFMVEARPGNGTTVRVTLPLRRAAGPWLGPNGRRSKLPQRAVATIPSRPRGARTGA